MRKQIAAANWKMNLTQQQAIELLNAIGQKDISLSVDQRVVFGVPFPYLLLANDLIKAKKGC